MRLGIDIGGTYIKFIVLQEDNIVYKSKIKTGESCEKIIEDIRLEYQSIRSMYAISSVGVGTPGVIKQGLVTAVNLPFKGIPLEKVLSERLGFSVKVDNDANCAALGEVYFGSAKDCQSIAMITLGTGIGGGIIINRQIYKGLGSAGEIGHMVIQAECEEICSCGLKGCFEQYASATALIKQAVIAANDCKDSTLFKMYQDNHGLDGELFFKAVKNGCPVGKEVLKQYLKYLAVGIESVANILHPEAVVLAGGITEEKELLINGLKEILRLEVDIRVSELKNDAGALGAAVL